MRSGNQLHTVSGPLIFWTEMYPEQWPGMDYTADSPPWAAVLLSGGQVWVTHQVKQHLDLDTVGFIRGMMNVATIPPVICTGKVVKGKKIIDDGNFTYFYFVDSVILLRALTASTRPFCLKQSSSIANQVSSFILESLRFSLTTSIPLVCDVLPGFLLVSLNYTNYQFWWMLKLHVLF